MNDYLKLRTVHNQDISGQIAVNSTGSTATLVTARSSTNHTIYVQQIMAFITTGSAGNWTFQDSSTGTSVVVAVIPSPANNTKWTFDFGPVGVPLGQGLNFVNTVSATGSVGQVEWYGYQRLTKPMAAGQTN